MMRGKLIIGCFSAAAACLLLSQTAFARDLIYKNSEVTINVKPGEPTHISFPGEVQGGFRKKLSQLHLDRRDSDLIVFANENLDEVGEAIIVRLKDGRSYSLRVRIADQANPRDDVIRVQDSRSAYVEDEEEEPSYKDRKFDYAPASKVSGLMREMILAAEFGKENIAGYRVSDQYKGETIMSDGTLHAVIDKIFIGPNLWGYVIDAHNQLDQSQQVNPASFRLDGTRAISAQHWELSPRPLNIEQQIASQDKTKIYVITKARKFR